MRFLDAMLAGIEASENAERNLAEIDAALDDFARQIHEASGGLIVVWRIGRDALYARRGSEPANIGRADKLCSIDVAPLGYPVGIRGPESVEPPEAQDRLELGQALASLLRSPIIGGWMARLLRKVAA